MGDDILYEYLCKEMSLNVDELRSFNKQSTEPHSAENFGVSFNLHYKIILSSFCITNKSWVSSSYFHVSMTIMLIHHNKTAMCY